MEPMEKMQFVIDLAERALESGELPIAAAIYHGDELISSAYTTERADGRWLVHAEQKALMDADMKKLPLKTRSQLELYTNLEPCLMCLGMAMSSFIGQVYYALEAPEDGAVDLVEGELKKRNVAGLSAYTFPKVHKSLLRENSIELFHKYATQNEGKPGAVFAATLAAL